MLESASGSKPRDALLEKLRERIKDRDRALEVKPGRGDDARSPAFLRTCVSKKKKAFCASAGCSAP